MKAYYWTGTAAFAVLLAAWGAIRPRPDLPSQPSTEVGDGGPAAQSVYRAAQLRAVKLRLVSKVRAVQALLAGDYTLLEAAASFRELDAADPLVRPESHPDVYVGATEAERYCRVVILWAGNYARSGGSEAEAEATVRRLEEELEGHRACGTMELPPAPGDTERGHGTPSADPRREGE
jgi:hypothetical protein